MTKLFEYLLDLLKLEEVKTEERSGNGEERRQSASWPRRFSFSQNPCAEEEPPPPPPEDTPLMCELPEDIRVEDQCPPSFFARKFVCMMTAGKNGLIEGSLTGVFFGGGWGMYKYVDQYVNGGGEGGDGGEGAKDADAGNKEASPHESKTSGGSKTSETGSKASRRSTVTNEDSTTNDNVIFVSACNCAIIVGVVCTLVNCTKAAIFC